MLSIAARRVAVRALAVAALLATSADLFAGKVYKWVDDQGRVHYGERPGGAGARAMELAPSDQRSGVGSVSTQRRDLQRRLLDAYEAERAEKRAAQQQQQAQAERLAGQCQRARADLGRLEFAQYLYRKGPDGEQMILSDAQRAEYIVGLKEKIRRYCSP